MEAAATRAGRKRDDISFMVVSKTQPVENIRQAYDAGIRLFGENRVAEAAEKFGGNTFPGASLHLIGHIQRNKARQAVEIADCIHSLDSERTADALIKQTLDINRTVEVLVEVNTSGEESKHGVRQREDITRLIEYILAAEGITLRGLMTMAPFTDDEGLIRKSFRKLHTLKEEYSSEYGNEHFPILSMGMTNDFEIAVEEGSTLVRVGSAVFGARH